MNLVSQHDLQMIAIWEASNSLSLLEDTVSPKAVGCVLGWKIDFFKLFPEICLRLKVIETALVFLNIAK